MPSPSDWGTCGVFRPVQFSVIVGGQPVAGGVVFEPAAFLPDPGEALEQRAEQWVLVLAMPDQRPGAESAALIARRARRLPKPEDRLGDRRAARGAAHLLRDCRLRRVVFLGCRRAG